MSTDSDLLWSPSRTTAESSNTAGFMRWLSETRGLEFSGDARCATATRVTALSTSAGPAPDGTSSSEATSRSAMRSAHSANSAYLFGKCR